jgi:DNA repair protein RadC
MIENKKNGVGHRKRLKERWLNAGLSGFSEHELLELLLSFSVPRKDTKIMAKTLIKEKGSIYQVLKSSPDKLAAIPGFGEHSAVLLSLCGALLDLKKPKLQGVKIKSSKDLSDYFYSEIGMKAEEYFYIVLLDQKNKIIALEEIEHGIENRAHIYIKRIVRLCLDNFATGIICVHNHPSGSTDFSKADLELTVKLHSVLKAVEVRLLDHLLITSENSTSMLEEGLYNFK